MDKFGFVIHPIDSGLITRSFNEPGLDFMEPGALYGKRTVERTLRWLPPFKCADITGVKSKTGKCIEGFFIFCPLIPEQMLNMDQQFVLRKVVESCELAEKLGANMVGLGAYVSQVGRKGAQVDKRTKLPVTIGTSYTIAVAVASTLKAARDVDFDLSTASIAIVGASGGIGSICARLIAGECRELILTARNETRLDQIAGILRKESKTKLTVTTDVRKAVRMADIILFSTNDPNLLIGEEDLRPGAIVCDISVPKNVSEETVMKREDIIVIDGGIVSPPGDVNFNFYYGPPPGLAYACVAETMILTLEGKFESYSIGGNVTIEKVMEISSLAEKHGFKVAEFRSFYGDITKSRIEKTKAAIKKRKKHAESKA
ncbi:MAG: shikimate dehydrogenase [Candidatus Omnitrophota bacterium]